MNTVLLSGKGMTVNLIFSILIQHYPDAVWRQPKRRWWQSETRHELRIQNLGIDEIRALQESFAVPGMAEVMIEVF